MIDRKAPYEVGYKRPPKHTQWQKCQCGNPKRQHKRAVKGTVELIDQAFAKEIDIVENGASRRVYVFEAILLQICSKELVGHKRATNVRLLYQDFIESHSGKREPEFIIEHISGSAAAWRSEK
jgi:Family of unknown function (DUF5681)